ncbi:retrovirus-related pol polyprotein from transposon TNT 1-94 [Tanacetum coccineum]
MILPTKDWLGLPKLKNEKDHLCYACSLRKSKKHTHKPKSEDFIQEKLYLLHMDLCGLMRIESINGKKYILIIVDDYSRFTWVKFLRSKDETLEFQRKFTESTTDGPVRLWRLSMSLDDLTTMAFEYAV